MTSLAEVLETPRGSQISIESVFDEGKVQCWTIPPFKERVQARFGVEPIVSPERPEPGPSLCVIGGGGLIDQAKSLAQTSSGWQRLIAVPVIYGSGAEVSPIAVTHEQDGNKRIEIGEDLIPHAYALWPELLSDFSKKRLLQASGDVWAHALEGFWSPLGDAALRKEGADLLHDMLKRCALSSERWFEYSARACQLQSRSSVGLIHGIAHVVEGYLRKDASYQGGVPGHAALCATMLLPVLSLHLEQSEKVQGFLAEHRLDPDAILSEARSRFDSELFQQMLVLMKACWPRIVRDPCTRTNPMLVRRGLLEFFEGFQG